MELKTINMYGKDYNYIEGLVIFEGTEYEEEITAFGMELSRKMQEDIFEGGKYNEGKVSKELEDLWLHSHATPCVRNIGEDRDWREDAKVIKEDAEYFTNAIYG